MNFAKVTLLGCAMAFVSMGGCGRVEASAAPSEKLGDKKDEPPPTPTAKGDAWNAEASVTHDKKDVWKLEIALHAADGYHVNLEYPYKFVGDKADGFTFEKDTIVKDDKRDPKDDKSTFFTLDKCKKGDKGDECSDLKLSIVLKPADAKAMSKATASGVLRFGVCNASSCKFDKAHLGVAVSAAKSV